MTSLEQYIDQLGQDGFRLHLWRTVDGWQANVSEPGGAGWTVAMGDSPLEAVHDAMRQRACGVAGRTVTAHDGYVDAPRVAREEQVDLEDAIAAAIDDEGMCVICESGGSGCDACRPADDDDFDTPEAREKVAALMQTPAPWDGDDDFQALLG